VGPDVSISIDSSPGDRRHDSTEGFSSRGTHLLRRGGVGGAFTRPWKVKGTVVLSLVGGLRMTKDGGVEKVNKRKEWLKLRPEKSP